MRNTPAWLDSAALLAIDASSIGLVEAYWSVYQTLLGKMLRIHIEVQPDTYSIPPDNAFVGSIGARRLMVTAVLPIADD